MAILSAEEWAEEQFSQCHLGDPRRRSRLIKIVTRLASQIGRSLCASCEGNDSEVEGAYRFARNEHVEPYEISKGLFTATVEKAKGLEELLALEDTTTHSYTHDVIDELGDIGAPEKTLSRGFLAHSVLLVNGKKLETIGLIEQRLWRRSPQERGKKHTRSKRAYEDKESYKWEESSKRVSDRLGEQMTKVISVCDREADIYGYLQYKIKHHQRFIVRASHNRLLDRGGFLFDWIENEAKLMGTYGVAIKQREGRKAREAQIEVLSGPIKIIRPKQKKKEAVEVNVVVAREITGAKETEERLCWILLTSEPIQTYEQVKKICEYYERRWQIEEYHKAWKTGAGSEELRLQSASNLERLLAILGGIAVRLLQLRESLDWDNAKNQEVVRNASCLEVLTKNEWHVLWYFVNKKARKKPPKQGESLRWAYESIAKLGGWNDSKKTGIASWNTIWHGWFRLQERVEGYEAASSV